MPLTDTAINTFAALATELYKIKSPMWTAGHAKQWIGNLEKYVLPVIGPRPKIIIKPNFMVVICHLVLPLPDYYPRSTMASLLMASSCLFILLSPDLSCTKLTRLSASRALL
jgi:hypothetical protein